MGHWGESQHSQVQPDLLEGHKLPSHFVLSLIDHAIGALSDLLYLLEGIHVCRAVLETDGTCTVTPTGRIPSARQQAAHNTLHSPSSPRPGSPHALPATHIVWEDGSRLGVASCPAHPNPEARLLLHCLATECRRAQTSVSAHASVQANLYPGATRIYLETLYRGG